MCKLAGDNLIHAFRFSCMHRYQKTDHFHHLRSSFYRLFLLVRSTSLEQDPNYSCHSANCQAMRQRQYSAQLYAISHILYIQSILQQRASGISATDWFAVLLWRWLFKRCFSFCFAIFFFFGKQRVDATCFTCSIICVVHLLFCFYQ